MSYLEDIYEELDALNYKKNSYLSFLKRLDELTGISQAGNKDQDKIIVKKIVQKWMQLFSKHLSATRQDWYIEGSPKLYIVVKQLEAIAFLTGEEDAVMAILNKYPLLQEIQHSIASYRERNFLNNTGELAFKNFSRSLLTIQFILRVLDPNKIRQVEESVCGVVGFIQSLLLANPLLYAKTVSHLAESATHTLHQREKSTTGLELKITEKSVLVKQSSNDPNDIHDADHIGLIGLRSAMNQIVPYSSEAGNLKKILFGVTNTDEVLTWMREAGYKDCFTLPVKKAIHIMQLNQLIADGYTIGFCTTGFLTKIILYGQENKKPNKAKQLLDGHFVLLTNIAYIPENNQISFSIMTWGTEVKDVKIDFDVFKHNKGLSSAIIGLNDYAQSTLRAKNREENNHFISPIAFCFYVKNIIESEKKEKEFKKLLTLIEKAKSHARGLSWFKAAKQLQNEIFQLSAEVLLQTDLKLMKEKSIIPGNFNKFNHDFSSWDSWYQDSPDQATAWLQKMALEQNIEALCRLISLYFSQNALDKIPALFCENRFTDWQNSSDKARTQNLLNDCCRNSSADRTAINQLMGSLPSFIKYTTYTHLALPQEEILPIEEPQPKVVIEKISEETEEVYDTSTIAEESIGGKEQLLIPTSVLNEMLAPSPTDRPRLSTLSWVLLSGWALAGVALSILKIAAVLGSAVALSAMAALAGPIVMIVAGVIFMATVSFLIADFIIHFPSEAVAQNGMEKVEEASLGKSMDKELGESLKPQSELKRRDARFFRGGIVSDNSSDSTSCDKLENDTDSVMSPRKPKLERRHHVHFRSENKAADPGKEHQTNHYRG